MTLARFQKLQLHYLGDHGRTRSHPKLGKDSAQMRADCPAADFKHASNCLVWVTFRIILTISRSRGLSLTAVFGGFSERKRRQRNRNLHVHEHVIRPNIVAWVDVTASVPMSRLRRDFPNACAEARGEK